LAALLDGLGVRMARPALWICTFVLGVLSCLGVLTIGLFLLPGLVLALLASLLSLLKRDLTDQSFLKNLRWKGD
jgi:apolipoprotein N-acyltransferase